MISSVGALNDLTVLDLTDEKGMYVGKLLADMGANVIKVEPPGGDSARAIGPFLHDQSQNSRSLFYWYHNTSKRSITLNLESETGVALFRQLTKEANVVLESHAPGVMESMGVAYPALSEVNPRLIMTSITGFGQTGPYKDYKTSDIVALAMAGIMASCGYDDIRDSPPIRPDGMAGYLTGCHYAAVSTLAAVYYRDFTGVGQHIDVSIHEALSCTTEAAMPWYFYHKKVVQRQTGRHHSVTSTPPAIYRASDGGLIHVFGTPPQTMNRWVGLLAWFKERAIGPELQSPEYRELVGARGRSPDLVANLFVRVGELIAGQTAAQVYQRAQEIGLPWGLVRSPEQSLEDSHLWDRGFFVDVPHPEEGRSYTYPGAPYVFSKTPWGIGKRAPLVGEDNDYIYTTRLGLSEADLRRLNSDGVI